MQLEKVRRLAVQVLKAGSGAIWMDPKESEKIQSAMTKDDVRELVKQGLIKKRKPQYKSMGMARILHEKRKKGRRSGHGKRTGSKKARMEGKAHWMKNVRSQRKMLRELRGTNAAAVEKIGYRRMYKMVKGNFFKGKNYLKAFVEGKKR
ncbi:MAG: 50S ribosomal protein L19e [Candidatus Diapherotrites archaeon]|nr:50S ribosomal protein L19e [Candidatus Diapherotrites archaeon]